MPSLIDRLDALFRADFDKAELAALRGVATEGPDRAHPTGQARAYLKLVADMRRLPSADVYRKVGSQLVAPLIKEQPLLVQGHRSVSTFLLTLSQSAPAALAVMAPEQPAPDFAVDYVEPDPDTLRIGFAGSVEAAWLMVGVVEGVAELFGERVQVRYPDETVQPVRDRQALLVKVLREQRQGTGSPPGVERRASVLSGVTTFLR